MDAETLPENLRPPVKPGDVIHRLVRLASGGWFWGSAVVVKSVDSEGTPYFRYRHGKVDKAASEWRVR